ncbi:MAG TPA: MBL fold metallo-hydrolase [Desulforhopalus sp.]|nr:MBL fold metallo-hydrolase [Desulforhopalus sp.]
MKTAELTLRIVVDNQTAPGLLAEHGFSLMLTADDHTLLLDTGQDKALRHNAAALGISLAAVNSLVLSHGHYDHSGGICDLLQASRRLQVYYHPAAFLPRYSVREDQARSIRITLPNRIALNALPEERLHPVHHPVLLTERIGITGEIPRRNPLETTGGPFFLDEAGVRPDPIEDDMAVWVKTSLGLVVAVGCCHAGIINTLTWIKELTGEEKIHTVIGGLHLLNADEERLTWTVNELEKLAITNLIPCHCAGDTAMRRLAERFDCRNGYAGMSLHVG